MAPTAILGPVAWTTPPAPAMETSANAAQSEFQLGENYKSGIGVERDVELAALWYEKAASKGHAQAQHELGLLHLRGDGIARATECAEHWLALAAANGCTAANEPLALLRPQATAERHYATACARACADPIGATASLERAAELGHPAAELLMGWRAFHGVGVPACAATASYWYRKAAEHGMPMADEQYAWCLLAVVDPSIPDATTSTWLASAMTLPCPTAAPTR